MSWTQALRIRIMLDADNEDVYRDIDIRSDQSFEELHQTIVQIFGIDSQDDRVSFFLADDFWKRVEELPLYEDFQLVEHSIADKALQEFILKDRQRLCYSVGDLTPWEFQLEVMGAYDADFTLDYPVLVESHGLMPDEPISEDFDSKDHFLENSSLEYSPYQEKTSDEEAPKETAQEEELTAQDFSFFGTEDEEEWDEEEWGDIEFED